MEWYLAQQTIMAGPLYGGTGSWVKLDSPIGSGNLVVVMAEFYDGYNGEDTGTYPPPNITVYDGSGNYYAFAENSGPRSANYGQMFNAYFINSGNNADRNLYLKSDINAAVLDMYIWEFHSNLERTIVLDRSTGYKGQAVNYAGINPTLSGVTIGAPVVIGVTTQTALSDISNPWVKSISLHGDCSAYQLAQQSTVSLSGTLSGYTELYAAAMVAFKVQQEVPPTPVFWLAGNQRFLFLNGRFVTF